MRTMRSFNVARPTTMTATVTLLLRIRRQNLLIVLLFSSHLTRTLANKHSIMQILLGVNFKNES